MLRKILYGLWALSLLAVFGLIAARLGWLGNPFLPPECRNAPKVVPYHDGMTLCPGQTATGVFEFEVPAGAPAARRDGGI
jgi:hypothetical protein